MNKAYLLSDEKTHLTIGTEKHLKVYLKVYEKDKLLYSDDNLFIHLVDGNIHIFKLIKE